MEKATAAQVKRWKKRGLTVAQCREEVAKVLQELRRVEAADDFGFVDCVTCSARRQYNDGMQGGHYISRQHASSLTRLNINVQCIYCNHYRGGALEEYRKFLGPRLAARLEKLKGIVINFTRENLAKRIVRFRARIKIEKARFIND